jgi:zinc transporter ZupT
MVPSSWTVVTAVGLAVVHLEAGQIRATALVSRRIWLSFAGGASLAYVFVHILPELNNEQETLGESSLAVVPFLEHHAYLVALAGFATFYGLERLAQRPRPKATDAAGDWVFWIHVASFGLYNVIIGYLLIHRITTGLWSLLFFFLAMGFHFFVTDAGFRRLHERPYHRYGRWLLAGAVLGGWVLGRSIDLSEVNLAVLFAFLAGGVVLNVIKEELPEQQQSNFVAFAVGAAGYAALLLFL